MATKRKAGAKKINVKIGKRRKRTHHAKAPARRRHASVGAVHHKPRRRKRSGGFLGATGGGATLKSIAWMAVGVTAGALLTHVVIRPIEAKLVGKWPILAKFIAAGEVLLGGIIAIKGKNSFIKAGGVGILAGGVHGLMKQVNLYKHLPGVSGSDMTELRIPISGEFTEAVAGLLEDSRRNVRTRTVAGSLAGLNEDYSKVVAGHGGTQMAGEMEDAEYSSAFVKY